MNYGMGGLISLHVDSTNWPDNEQSSSEVNDFGGVRFITFMVYLSDVLSGGHTVFPQLGQGLLKLWMVQIQQKIEKLLKNLKIIFPQIVYSLE